jgi:redox-sensitive bicupin YhaK (pirin superfamily)
MAGSGVGLVITSRVRDLGDGFEVRRALPAHERRSIGPFVFFDQMGPTVFREGTGLDVRPHPHIGLATVTYLFEGEILHRDSLGTVEVIRPGAVNWMTAGSGIVHSERTPPEARQRPGSRLFGVQTWVALPKHAEETPPAFAHHEPEALPMLEEAGATVRLIVGTLYGLISPVVTLAPTLLADAALPAGARLDVPAEHEERAVYVAEWQIAIGGAAYGQGQLLVLSSRLALTLSAITQSRLVLFGGEPLDGPRHLWWNFVASTPDQIEQAKAGWRGGRFPPVPGETEFIPLPE